MINLLIPSRDMSFGNTLRAMDSTGIKTEGEGE